jgi:hypothetical protein
MHCGAECLRENGRGEAEGCGFCAVNGERKRETAIFDTRLDVIRAFD